MTHGRRPAKLCLATSRTLLLGLRRGRAALGATDNGILACLDNEEMAADNMGLIGTRCGGGKLLGKGPSLSNRLRTERNDQGKNFGFSEQFMPGPCPCQMPFLL